MTNRFKRISVRQVHCRSRPTQNDDESHGTTAGLSTHVPTKGIYPPSMVQVQTPR